MRAASAALGLLAAQAPASAGAPADCRLHRTQDRCLRRGSSTEMGPPISTMSPGEESPPASPLLGLHGLPDEKREAEVEVR